jgi:hypothetical protein
MWVVFRDRISDGSILTVTWRFYDNTQVMLKALQKFVWSNFTVFAPKARSGRPKTEGFP